MTTQNTPTLAELLKSRMLFLANHPTYINHISSGEAEDYLLIHALQEAVEVLQSVRQIQWHGEMKDGKPVLQNIADPNCKELLSKWGFK